MKIDDLFYIVHIKVAYFYNILVKDLMQPVVGWKFFSDEYEENFSDVSLFYGGLYQMVFLCLCLWLFISC